MKSEHGVQASNTASLTPADLKYNWDDIRFLRVVAETGTLRRAGVKLGVATNTVRARIVRLETSLKRTLVRRSRGGTRLTDEGSRLLETTHALGEAGIADHTPDAESALVRSGRLTIGCSEGIGNLWLAPRIAGLTKQLPNIGIDLSFDYDLAHDRASNCDIWLTFERPTDPDVIVSKLATVHFLGFASRAYIKRCGTPASAEDLKRHHIVEHAGPGVRSDLLDYLIGSDRPPGMIELRSNSSLAQLRAVMDGVGIGGLPTFVCELTRSLRTVAPDVRVRRELWLGYHVVAKQSPAIRRAVAWLRTAFDPYEHPCFADAFIPPSDLIRTGARDRVFRHFDQGSIKDTD